MSAKKQLAFRWFGLIEKETTTPCIFTPWSLVHFLFGGAAKQLGVPFLWFEAIHGAYEFKDQFNRELYGHYNSFLNTLGDQTSATVGYIVCPSSTNQTFVWIFIGSTVLAWLTEDKIGEYLG